MSQIPAHVVALAARTAVGLTAEESAASVRAGISRLSEHPFLVDASGGALLCARDGTIDVEMLGAERFRALLEPALVEITDKLARDLPLETVRLFLALPEERPGHSRADGDTLVTSFESFRLPSAIRLTIELVGQGHAGALAAIARATAAVAGGAEEVAIAGGVDSYYNAETVDWLEAENRLRRPGAPSGFPPGEGASLIAVAGRTGRKRLGLPSLALVRGVASGHEPRAPSSDEGLLGETLGEVLAAAADSGGGGEAADGIFCDINGERWRVDDWGFAALRTSQLFRDATAYGTAVSECGDVGAATGALGCVLAVRSFQRRYCEGPRAMVWGASWGGLRGAVLLEQGTE